MIGEIVRRLEERQAELAHAALASPSERTEFEYGRVSGMFAGLEDAKNLILNYVADKDAKQNTF